MIGKDYDDADWDTLLDQLTYDEMVTLIGRLLPLDNADQINPGSGFP